MEPMSDLRLRGILRFATERGWILSIRDRLGDETPLWKVDGVLATLRAKPETDRLYAHFRKQKTPLVDMVINRPFLRCPRVANDHRAVGALAAEHLRERGFTRAAFFSTTAGSVVDLRYAGFAERFDEPPFRWQYGKSTAGRPRDFGIFLSWMRRHFKCTERPLGILANNETDAALVLNACLQLGVSVPEEVAILAIGNDFGLCEHQQLPISDVEQDMEGGAYRAAELLERLMNGEKSSLKPVLVPPKGIVVRKSTDVLATSDQNVRHALAYIAEHLGESFGAEQIADALGVNRAPLEESFLREIGRSVAEEIHRERLQRATKLLAESDLPVKAIAADCGFCSPSYFVKIFREHRGQTPLRFRKMKR